MRINMVEDILAIRTLKKDLIVCMKCATKEEIRQSIKDRLNIILKEDPGENAGPNAACSRCHKRISKIIEEQKIKPIEPNEASDMAFQIGSVRGLLHLLYSHIQFEGLGVANLEDDDLCSLLAENFTKLDFVVERLKKFAEVI